MYFVPVKDTKSAALGDDGPIEKSRINYRKFAAQY